MESSSFEDAIRNVISIGGDSDTLGAITGAIAGEYYGIPYEFEHEADSRLDGFLKRLTRDFIKAYPVKITDTPIKIKLY